MDDSDSGVGSISSIISSSRATSSMSGDDRSTAGSRSSAASLSLSEVSSPAPSQQQQTNNSSNNSNSGSQLAGLNQEPIRVWRDLEQATQIRHIHSVQHHPLMLTPPGHPVGPGFSLPMSLLLPPPTNIQYTTDLWTKQQVGSHSRYEEDKLVRDRREMEYRDLERHKDMERERERAERHHHQIQQQERDRERERQAAQQQQEKQMTEQAVTKHFEESLRRAKEKQQQQFMRPTWTLNAIPPPHQTSAPPSHLSHLSQQSHVPPSQTSNQNSGGNNPGLLQDDRRRTISVDHDRAYLDREIEKDRYRIEQQRAFYAANSIGGIPQRTQSKNEYSQSSASQTASLSQHRGISIQPSSKSNEKLMSDSGGNSAVQQQQQQQQRISMESGPGNYKMYNYSGYPSQLQSSTSSSTPTSSNFHKEMNKSKPELVNSSLSNPPPLLSDIKQSAGVIVKHDASINKIPIQLVQTTKHATTHYSGKNTSIPNHQIYEYRTQQQSPHDRYKSPSVTVLSTSQSYQIRAQTPPTSNQQQQQQHQSQQSPLSQQSQNVHFGGATITPSISTKPKLQTPASHFYGKPSGAGIVSGIPVCRSQDASVFVTKSPSPSSPFHSQQQLYGSGPPPAHSRHEYRMHQQPNAVVGGTGVPSIGSSGVGVGKSSLSHSIANHPHHSHNAHHLSHHTVSSPPTSITNISAPHTISSRSPGLITSNLVGAQSQMVNNQSFQTQPLDLGVSNRDESNTSVTAPKRKGTPIHHPVGSPIPLDIKKKKIEISQQNSPLELRVNTPSPHVTASPTIIPPTLGTTDYNIHQVVTKTSNMEMNHTIDITTTPSKSPISILNSSDGNSNLSIGGGGTGSGDDNNDDVVTNNNNNNSSSNTEGTTFTSTKLGVTDSSNFLTNNTLASKSGPSINNNSNTLPSTNSSPSQSPGVVLSSGSSGTGNQSQTPAKLDVTTINNNNSNTNTILNQVTSSTDSSKSTSPVTKSSSSSAPRHLKKAWLQRHKTGEDFDDSSITGGGGNCVKLPLTIATQSNCTSTPPPVHSLHTVGSMAINSINKTKSNLVGVNSSNAKVSSSQHPKKILVNQSNFTSGGVNNSNNTSKGDNSNNGHNTDSDLDDNSSSSDQERTTKNPLKRKSSKVKKRKGGITRKPQEDLKKKKVTNTVSESDKDSDSEHDSMSDKDSDSGTSTSQGNKKTSNGSRRELADSKEPRKRGRRPKTSTSKDDTGSTKKKQKEESPSKDPFRKPPISQLKKTGDSFLQDGPCFEVAPKLAKCRECRWTPNQRSKNTPNIFCRFYAFRRLRYTKNSQLAIAGFSDPHKDPTEEDLKLWMPDHDNPPTDLDLQMSRFLLAQVGDQFCDLLQQEKEAMSEHMSDDKTIAWKRVVQGVREMCDVCETTLFNYHWACGKCGFVVCLDCYKDRKIGSAKIWGEQGKDRDECSWLLCTNRSSHEQEKLMLTQIIAGDSLQVLGRRTHETRALWDIPQYCGCGLSMEPPKATNGICKEFIKNLLKNDALNGITVKEGNDRLQNGKSNETSESALSWLADVALQQNNKKNNGTSNSEDDDEEDDDDFDTDDNDDLNKQKSSTLRELLIRPSSGGSSNVKPNGSRANSPNKSSNPNLKKSKLDSLDEVISSVIENSKKEEKCKSNNFEDNIKTDTDDKSGVTPVAANQMTDDHKMELKHFICKQRKFKHQLPIRIMTMVKSSSMYPNVPHTWLCDGKLLRLLDPINPGNYRIFQDQWKRGQPVLVSEVTKNLNVELWHPDSFAKDFGDGKNDLINCMNGNLLPNQSMKRFWEGFENITKRLKDDKGNPMLLKLKDWPPGEDFAEILPTRFNDLMKCLPLGDYTQRNGRLNLASRLPDCFVRPDLGPKMYNAYGSALYANKGTTNLHLDISDAVNVMVYIGIPKDGPDENYLKTEAYKAIDEAGCDILMRRRVRDKGETPGAIWHIYAAKDADKIRDLLNKVAIERGERLEANHDPIHDQSWYLDGPLRERLYREYGVEGYPIAQCLGDAVFIPAGAPHQVRNLHNCIKVAEDFVSPENVYHCFHLTHEFRELSDTHSNHEDKLQIKNIIYHAVKDALACLSHLLGQRITENQATDVSSTTSTSNQIKIKTEIKTDDDENDNNDV